MATEALSAAIRMRNSDAARLARGYILFAVAAVFVGASSAIRLFYGIESTFPHPAWFYQLFSGLGMFLAGAALHTVWSVIYGGESDGE